MNAVRHRRSGDDPETGRETTTESPATRQHSAVEFDARDRLRGALDETTVRQAVLGLPQEPPQRLHTESEC
jgi:hypothetical protein